MDQLIEEYIRKEKPEEAFYVINVDDIIAKYQNWLIKLPRVKPFYAVKSNDNPLIVEVLGILGTGFDCASKVNNYFLHFESYLNNS
jgi:ornithine decarboxylase